MPGILIDHFIWYMAEVEYGVWVTVWAGVGYGGSHGEAYGDGILEGDARGEGYGKCGLDYEGIDWDDKTDVYGKGAADYYEET